jgi:ketosteroid isomerase-like protein
MTDHWQSSPVQRKWKHIWIHGFVIGVGVVLVSSVIWFFLTGTPSSSTTHKDETAPQVQAPPGERPPAGPPAASQAPVDSPAPLKSQLAQVLGGIREANQKKDLSQLLSHYSPDFPKLYQRAQHISETWKIYDYPKMDFEIAEVRLLADQTAVARVTWDVEAHNISTRKNKNLAKTYLIRFARESGQWRIRALDQAE